MTNQTTPLRDRIAAALMDLGHPQWDAAEGADAVLAVLPAPVDRDAVRDALRRADEAEVRAAAMERGMESTAADALKHRGCHSKLMAQCQRAERAEAEVERLRTDRAAVLREGADVADRLSMEVEQTLKTREVGPLTALQDLADLLRRMADETATTETQPDEDPARIDRLRPEFFEHASVESIDAQIRRAQRQQRHWGDRERTLGILRQAQVTQKENGEWPAAGARQDGAQP